MSPLCESYVTAGQLNQMERFYPLHVFLCEQCFLAQLHQYVSAESIFSEYAYFSSYSESWVEHAKRYAAMIAKRLSLGAQSLVIEVASNDGYLLQHFLPRGIPVLGIEPAANVAAVAESHGIPTLVKFFGRSLAGELAAAGKIADLIVGNNVLAQVPDINDFVGGINTLLGARGVATLEFPHLMRLMAENQFDTIYHEHFSYFSFLTVERIFAAHGMKLVDVEELPTHGGSLRIYARHIGDHTEPTSDTVIALREKEQEAGVRSLEHYSSFADNVKATKRKLLDFLIGAKQKGLTIAGYGAPGKGNTLLNYCGIRTDFVDYTVDRNTYKQGKYLPGTHIPILHPDTIKQTKPDLILILPWNVKEEIMAQLSYIREWGGRFLVPIPEVRVYS